MFNMYICDCPFQAIDAKKVKDVMMKHVYDKCPAVAAVGKYLSDLWDNF